MSSVLEALSRMTIPLDRLFFSSRKAARLTVETYGFDHLVPLSSTISSYLTHLQKKAKNETMSAMFKLNGSSCVQYRGTA